MTSITKTRITKEHVERTLLSLIDDLRDKRFEVPPHQREYCWTGPQQNKFILSVLKGYPIPSILMSASRANNEKPTLEDGRQRLTTARMFRDDQITCEGRKYSEMTEREKERFDDERVLVITFYNATQDQRIEIFDWHQNGAPLTPGERYHAHQATPLVKFVKETLMTPGIGLHDRAAATWGIRGDAPDGQSKDKRRKWLQSAVALVTGLAYGPKFMNKNYNTVVENNFMTSPAFNDAKKLAVLAELNRILEIYEEAQRIQPVAGSSWHKVHWDVGNFTGYIAYSLSSLDRMGYKETADAIGEVFDYDEKAYEPNSVSSQPDEWNRLKTTWVKYIVSVRREALNSPAKSFNTILKSRHQQGMGKDRNWKLDRWTRGYNIVFGLNAADHDNADNENMGDDSDTDSDD